MATTLYRCKTPTDYLCPCGRVARRLRYAGIDYDEVRVRVLKRDRPEVAELSGQRWVPVLVHGDEVIHDSKRIIQFVERPEPQRSAGVAVRSGGSAGSAVGDRSASEPAGTASEETG